MELYVARNGQRLGPFPLDEVQRRVAAGEFSPLDLAWAEGRTDWAPLTSFLPANPAPVSGPPPLTAANTAPYPGGASPYMAPPAFAPAPQTSGLATASLICGILSITMFPVFTTLPAIICGHMARSRIKASEGKLTGSGLALAGLITGYGGLLILVAIIGVLVAIAVPAFQKAKAEAEKATHSLSQSFSVDLDLQQEATAISDACQAYANDHDGNFPPKLADLAPDYLKDEKLKAKALSQGLDFDYFGGKQSEDDEKVILRSKTTGTAAKHVVAYADGTVDFEEESPNVSPEQPKQE